MLRIFVNLTNLCQNLRLFEKRAPAPWNPQKSNSQRANTSWNSLLKAKPSLSSVSSLRTSLTSLGDVRALPELGRLSQGTDGLGQKRHRYMYMQVSFHRKNFVRYFSDVIDDKYTMETWQCFHLFVNLKFQYLNTKFRTSFRKKKSGITLTCVRF